MAYADPAALGGAAGQFQMIEEPDSSLMLLGRLEFLFSDSNLHKDGHLRGLMNKHRGYVPLSAVAAFPTVANIPGCSVPALAEAVLSSPILQLSSDGASVRRTVPYVLAPPDYYDDRTIYVENFPANSDHASLATYFSQWGLVTYVSLPRYKSAFRCVIACGVLTYPTTNQTNKL